MMVNETKLEVGCGWGKGDDSFAAGADAARQALSGIRQCPLSLVLVFAASCYDLEELLRGVGTIAGDAPVAGVTTAGEIYDGPLGNSVVVTILASPFLEVSVGLGRGVSQDWRQAVAQAAGAPGLAPFFAPYDDAAWSELTLQGKSAFALMFAPGETSSTTLRTFEILEELKSRSRDRLPVIGGAAGDDLRMETNSVLWGGRAYPDSLLLVLCRTQLRFGISMAHGLAPTAQRVMATRTFNHEVAELDGQAAAEVYSRVQGHSRESLEGQHLTLATGRTLGTLDPYGQYSINVAAYFTPDGGLRMAQPVAEGTMLTIMAGTPESVAAAGREALRKALLRGSITQAAVVLAFSCALRAHFLGESLPEETRGMQQLLPGVPIAGFYSMGEQGLADDGVNRNNTDTIAVLVLGRELSYAAQVALEREGLRREVEQAGALKMAYAALEQEVAERRKAEQALRDSEGFLANVFDGIQDGLTVLDRDLTIRRVNPATEKRFSQHQTLVGKKCYAAFHGLPSPCEACPSRHTLETGEAAHKTAFASEGGRWIDVYTYPLRDPASGAITGVIEYAKDITQRVQAEEGLRVANDRLTNLLEASPLPIISLDAQGRVLTWNGAAEQTFGWGEDEVLGEPLPYIRAEDLSLFREGFNEELSGKSYAGLETVCLKKDGSQLNIKVFTAPLRAAGGEITGSVGILEDITALKQAEQALQKSEEQLRQAQKMEAVGRLAGGVAHDFNNILTAISGYSELLLQNFQHQDPRRLDVEQIQQATERAATLTRQLLAFSRKQVIQPRRLNLNDVVANMDKMLRRILREDIDLQTILTPDLGAVTADPGQMEQVVLNLAINARDAMPQGGKLTIETGNVELEEDYVRSHAKAKPGRYTLLAVSDTGVGVAPEIKEHLFEPFFTTKKQGAGTGLGLSMVYGIVEHAGGFIGVYSEPGHGTTFKIYLPRTDAAAAEVQPSSRPISTEPGSETILLAEDEDLVRMVTSRMLAVHGYTVMEAAGGPEALCLAREHPAPIQLLLTDVVMPELNGPKLAEALKPLHPEMKVLYMSGHTENAIVHHGVLEAGVSFIQKPFRHDTLLQKVKEVLGVVSGSDPDCEVRGT
jgi:two-component system, cell cycle sensor histidine kinase and response regulator CckA